MKLNSRCRRTPDLFRSSSASDFDPLRLCLDNLTHFVEQYRPPDTPVQNHQRGPAAMQFLQLDLSPQSGPLFVRPSCVTRSVLPHFDSLVHHANNAGDHPFLSAADDSSSRWISHLLWDSWTERHASPRSAALGGLDRAAAAGTLSVATGRISRPPRGSTGVQPVSLDISPDRVSKNV